MEGRVSVAVTGLPAIPGVSDLRVVGRGGFGTVYRGRQPELGRDVAVKVLTSDVGPMSTAARWRREVTAMGRLSNHPNIVAVYSGGVTGDGLPYLVMPFVPGGSLEDVVREHGPMAPPDVAVIGAKLAGALASAHAVGVLHRDVKPANVLVSPYGEPQLTDFGIARVGDATVTATYTKALAMTVGYAPPEVLDGRPATERSDVYSLAATLHMLLTGEAPFRARPDEPLVSIAVRIATEPAADLRDRGVPAPLAVVIADGLAKDPERRIGSAHELRHRLDAAASALGAGEATVVIPPPAPSVSDDPASRLASTAAAPVAAPPRKSPQDRPGAGAAAARTGAAAGSAAVTHSWVPEPPRVDDSRRPGEGRRRTAVLAGLVVLVLLVAGALLFVTQSDRDRNDASSPTSNSPASTTSTTVAPMSTTVAPAATASPETAAPTTDRTETSTATSTPAGTAEQLEDLAVTYLDLLDQGRLDDAFALLSPAMKGSQPRSAYDDFWSGFDSIQVVGTPTVDESAAAVTVPISLDGSREDYRLIFVQDGDGSWLIDGPRPR